MLRLSSTDKRQTNRACLRWSRVVSSGEISPENLGSSCLQLPPVASFRLATNQEVARSSRAGRTITSKRKTTCLAELSVAVRQRVAATLDLRIAPKSHVLDPLSVWFRLRARRRTNSEQINSESPLEAYSMDLI